MSKLESEIVRHRVRERESDCRCFWRDRSIQRPGLLIVSILGVIKLRGGAGRRITNLAVLLLVLCLLCLFCFGSDLVHPEAQGGGRRGGQSKGSARSPSISLSLNFSLYLSVSFLPLHIHLFHSLPLPLSLSLSHIFIS